MESMTVMMCRYAEDVVDLKLAHNARNAVSKKSHVTLTCPPFLDNQQARSPKHKVLGPSGCFRKGTTTGQGVPLVADTTCRKTM